MRRSTRWLVPAGVGVLVAGLALAPGASADLPAKTPDEVLVMAAEADVPSFSGTVVVRNDLGIPTSLLTGPEGGPPMDAAERTIRLWKDGDDLARASVASLMGEQTIIRNGDALWVYDSDTGVVRTGDVPEPTDKADAPWADDVPDPAEAAQWLLDALEPTTTVTAGEPTVVAGREAYEVVLTPQQAGTLVGTASMAVDAQTGAVLRVQVTPVGSGSPAIEVAFTEFDPTAPSADVFALSTPPGASVEPWDTPESYDKDAPAPTGEGPQPTVIGEGWTSVVVLPAGAVPDQQEVLDGQGSPEGLPMLPADVLTPVEGGQVFSTALVTVMLADDGRVLAGAVTPDVLVAAAR